MVGGASLWEGLRCGEGLCGRRGFAVGGATQWEGRHSGRGVAVGGALRL